MKALFPFIFFVLFISCKPQQNTTKADLTKDDISENVVKENVDSEIGIPIPYLYFVPGKCEYDTLKYEVNHPFDGDTLIVWYEIELFLCQNPNLNLVMCPRLESLELDESLANCRVQKVFKSLINRGVDTSRVHVDNKFLRQPIIDQRHFQNLTEKDKETATRQNGRMSYWIQIR